MTLSKISLIACDRWLLLVRPRFACRADAKSDAAAAPQPAQKQFDTPKQAADALVQVAANFDVAAAKEILGPDSEDIIASEDPVQDKNRAAEFAAKAKEKIRSRPTRKIRIRPFFWWGTMIFRCQFRS